MRKRDLYRRRLVTAGLCLVSAAALPRQVLACAAAPVRALSFFNTHTNEQFTATYFSGAAYDPAALERFDQLLRDHRNGEVGRMDPALFDYLSDVAARTGAEPAFDVISGFRSLASNEMLRTKSSGVSQNSLHLQGKAIDVRLRGVSIAKLRDVALELARGGVGYYPKSDFVHLDTGRVRSWNG